MGQTNEFERDLENQAMLKRPGRIDFRIFQNTPDAGDGSPGLQRCFRNYLHEGGMEKDIDLLGHSIKGTSVDINNAELQQLSNIGSATISGIQWGYVGEADQPVKQADSPTFLKIITTQITGTAPFTVSSSTVVTNLNADQCDGQHLGSSNSPIFVGLTLSANLVTTSTIDGVDVAGLKTDVDGFTDELKNLTTHEIQQLETLGETITILGTQWGYLGASNQGVATTNNVAFGQITMSGNIIMGSDDITFIDGGLVDNVDVSGFKSSYDTHVGNANAHISNLTDITTRNHDSLANKDGNSIFLHSTTTEQTNWNSAHTHITQNGSSHGYINQSITTGASPVFVGLTLSANLVTTSTIDGVDVLGLKTSYDTHVGNANAHISNLTDITTRNHSSLQNIGTSDHHVKTENTWRPISSIQDVFGVGRTINTASGTGTTLNIGSATNYLRVWGTASYVYLCSSSGVGLNLKPDGPANTGFVIKYNTGGHCNLYNEGSTEATELGYIGGIPTAKKPLEHIYARGMYDDDGVLGDYSNPSPVLEALRNLKVWNVRKKAMSDNFPNQKQKVWDMNTLPWIKFHPDIDALKPTDNTKRYSSHQGAKTGYLLSALKKLLERQDRLISKLNELGINISNSDLD